MNDERVKTNSNTSLFLMELIMVIGFFSLVAVICVRLFVAASVASTDSVDVNRATRLSESLLEAWSANSGDLKLLAETFPGSELVFNGDSLRAGVLTLKYDADWRQITGEGEGEYTVTLAAGEYEAAEIYGEDTMGRAMYATVSTHRASDGAVFCSMTADHYLGDDDE
ncbi:MAG: hypothetical protein K6C95_01840 [Lachnospiraceae bacterium]|nr:hypothetical protein [Lachnospiraceae bacterium]